MTALHLFDLDGTLLRDTSSPLEISRRLGVADELVAVQDLYDAGEIDSAGFAARVRELWGDLTPETVREVAESAPWIDGIEDVCADIAARGETSVLITLSPDFFARHLHDRGMTVVHASRFPPVPFAEDADPAEPLSPPDKVRLAEMERLERDLPRTACVAYGDSLTDGPLFAAYPHTVAVNARPELEVLARTAYRGGDLREAYARGRALLES